VSESTKPIDVTERDVDIDPIRVSAPMPAQRAEGTIDRYIVVDKIGAGGMGEVWKAYDPQLGRLVAIKVVHSGLAKDVESKRLQREAQAIAQLTHPNVIAVHDVGVANGEVFVAMEYVPGVAMRDWIIEGPHGHKDVLEVFVQAANGLAAAHDAGLVHRDFKPANVLIGDDGRVRVLDFGLARRSGERAATAGQAERVSPQLLGRQLTREGAVAGTPRYMAPEQHKLGEVDARADQFAFCAAMYEALTRHRPFDGGEGYKDLARNVCEGRVKPFGAKPPVPQWVRSLVLRGLSPNPDDRFASMHELVAEIDRDRGRARRGSLDGSTTTEAMIAAFPPPDDARTAARVQWLRERLEYTWQLKREGDFEGALELSRVVVRQAHQVDYLPLRAAALYVHGNLQHRTGDPASAKETLYLAAQLAGHSGDDWQVANTLVFLVAVLADGLRRYQEAEGIARVAEVAIARVGDNPSLSSRLHNNSGRSLREQGRCWDALREYELALALDERTHGNSHPLVVLSLANLADTLLELDRGSLARVHLERAISICREHDRRGPTLATCLLIFGRALIGEGEHDRACECLDEARSIWNEYPDRAVDLAETLTELALAHLATGDATAAVEWCVQAMNAHRGAAFAPLGVATTQLCLARALTAQGTAEAFRIDALTTAARDTCEALGEVGSAAFARATARMHALCGD